MSWILFETGCAKWIRFMENGTVQFHSNVDNATRFESSKEFTDELLEKYGILYLKGTMKAHFGY